MMINGGTILALLLCLALAGFILGALASIWLGPIWMLWGALGLPLGATALVIIGLIIGAVTG